MIFRLYCSYWLLKPTDFNDGYSLTVRYARLFTTTQARPGPKLVSVVQSSRVSAVKRV